MPPRLRNALYPDSVVYLPHMDLTGWQERSYQRLLQRLTMPWIYVGKLLEMQSEPRCFAGFEDIHSPPSAEELQTLTPLR